MKEGKKTGGFKGVWIKFACNLHVICVICSQEVIFELELRHCFPQCSYVPIGRCLLPPLSPHSRIQHSYIQKKKKEEKNFGQGGIHQVHRESLQCVWDDKHSGAGRYLVNAHWSSSPASLSSRVNAKTSVLLNSSRPTD